jgi:hypothetical protein
VTFGMDSAGSEYGLIAPVCEYRQVPLCVVNNITFI